MRDEQDLGKEMRMSKTLGEATVILHLQVWLSMCDCVRVCVWLKVKGVDGKDEGTDNLKWDCILSGICEAF